MFIIHHSSFICSSFIIHHSSFIIQRAKARHFVVDFTSRHNSFARQSTRRREKRNETPTALENTRAIGGAYAHIEMHRVGSDAERLAMRHRTTVHLNNTTKNRPLQVSVLDEMKIRDIILKNYIFGSENSSVSGEVLRVHVQRRPRTTIATTTVVVDGDGVCS